MEDENKKDFFSKPIFWFILFVIFVITLIISTRREKNDIVLTDNNLIVNATRYNIDTLTRIILFNIYEIDNAEILITYMPIHLEYYELEDGVPLAGYMTVNPYKEKSYFIFLSRFQRGPILVNLLAHELVHIKQYYSGDLVKLNEYVYLYKTDTVDVREVKYTKRIYEIDAYDEEKDVIKQLHQILYK